LISLIFGARGICLRKYEIESLLKSFLLFFALIMIVYGLYVWQNYTNRKHQLDTRILQEMKLFVYDPTSDRFGVDFVPPTPETTLLVLHYSDDEVYGFFKVPTMDNYLMKVVMPMYRYRERLEAIRSEVIRGMLLYILLIVIVSLLLAYYSLMPIRRALKLNKEFMKDILHDVNTPIASIAVNLKLLQKKFGEQKAIERINSNIKTLVMMRENMQAYLGDQNEEDSELFIRELVSERLEYYGSLYPNIMFDNRLDPEVIFKVPERTCIRILDNIIGNAAKYNKQNGNGTVKVYLDKDLLVVSDTGRGIKNIEKVFDRHYKEGERGMGLGLHIVWKLARKMGISVKIESEVDKGTRVMIDCAKVRIK